MKTLKLICVALTMLICTSSFAQYTTSKKKPVYQWSIAPTGGALFPVGVLGDNFKPGASLGLDIGYRVNKEVGMFAKLGYSFMNSKITGAPVGNYLEYSVGPRYTFTKPNLKSTLFVEAGVGGYTFMQDSYIDPNDINGGAVAQINNTRPGVNAGLGANLGLSDAMDLIVKSKYTVIFTPNGSNSFITTLAGFNFKF